MSCYVVSPKHISAIIRYACTRNHKVWGGNPSRYIYSPGEEQAAVETLYAANANSVNARYKATEPTDGIRYDCRAPQLNEIQVIKAIDCLAYQCDNWPEFEGSAADQILKSIKQFAIMALPGYSDAEWSID
jgi:hypothetical protein